MPIHIRPFEPRDQIPARQLILNGLGEHFGWIDETRNPDLDDIAANYLQRGNVFVVAEIGGELVGTGGLITVDANTARIVRMSVSRNHLRKGIGRALVMHLLDVARQRNIQHAPPHYGGPIKESRRSADHVAVGDLRQRDRSTAII